MGKTPRSVLNPVGNILSFTVQRRSSSLELQRNQATHYLVAAGFN